MTKIEIRRIQDADTNEYQLMEKLLTDSFPEEEYRDLPELRTFTKNKGIFHNNLIYDNGTFIGLITYWDFGRFYYVEHFAILPEMRNHGYGKTVLEKTKELLHLPIVLEVECPTEEMARRRIKFYERQGFVLWKHEYMQPPYRPGGDGLPLLLMAYGNLNEPQDFATIEKAIHKEVYGYE